VVFFVFFFFFFFFYIARRLYAKTFCALSTKERKVPFLNETLTLSTPLETKRRKEIKMVLERQVPPPPPPEKEHKFRTPF
jgi:hypothetical protein